MNDIFISYANSDRAAAQQLADALEALGWSVWWDREIPFGKPFDQVIEEELNAARCVIGRKSRCAAAASALTQRERPVGVAYILTPDPAECAASHSFVQ